MVIITLPWVNLYFRPRVFSSNTHWLILDRECSWLWVQGIQENFALHSWTRKHESLISKQRKLLLSEIWSVKKDEKQATGDLGSQTQGCESSLMKKPGRKEPVRWRAGAWDPILLWPPNPSPKASTSPDINAEKLKYRGWKWTYG